MNMQHFIVKISVVAGFGLLALFAMPRKGLYAQTPCQSQNIASVPSLTSKCNEFTFDATRSQIPVSPDITFLWEFGDGQTSSEAVVTHTYRRSGYYTVNLSITDNSGFKCSTATASQTVRVNIPPHASFNSEDRSCVNRELAFDGGPSYSDMGKILDYAWDFGDGETRRGAPQIKKSYAKGGNYRVRLTVDDQSGTFCSNHTTEKTVHINEPPLAEAGDDILFQCADPSGNMVVHFDASATTDANHDPLTYIWDFGDGKKEKGIKISHHYKKAGNYDVKLIVSDNTGLGCGTGVDFVTVMLSQPPKAKAGDDLITCVGEDVAFDGSRSYVHKKGTASAQWFFGDGTSSKSLYTTHPYDRPGTYLATLSLEDKLNVRCPVSRDTRAITVNSPPTARIQSVSSGCVRKEIFFDAASSVDADGDNLRYYWNFGDGTAADAGSKISHAYTQGGNYRVSVVVDDQKGTTCSTATAHANIHINTPPTADAGPNLSCCAGQEALFCARNSIDPDGDRLTFTWDFGDGTKLEGESVTHAYSRDGTYNVVLTVDDNSGSSCRQSTDGFVAVVTQVPVPVIRIRQSFPHPG